MSVNREEFYPGKREPTEEEINAVGIEYAAGIKFPQEKYAPQFFLCPIGDMGSGKSTVLKLLQENFPLVRISNDDIRKLLFDKGFLPTVAPRAAWTLTDRFAREKYSLAFDSNCVSFAIGERKAQFDRMITETGAQIIWIHINPPEKYLLKKLSSLDQRLGSAPWLFRSGAPSVERYLAKRMDPKVLVGIPFVYTFDTSKSDLTIQIMEATEKIKVMLGKI